MYPLLYNYKNCRRLTELEHGVWDALNLYSWVIITHIWLQNKLLFSLVGAVFLHQHSAFSLSFTMAMALYPASHSAFLCNSAAGSPFSRNRTKLPPSLTIVIQLCPRQQRQCEHRERQS